MARRRGADYRTLDLFVAPHAAAPSAPQPTAGGAAAIAAPPAPTFFAIAPDALEVRPYADFARAAWDTGGNFGIVADTASGKTYLALALADDVLARGQRVLLIAPTNPLCEQHARVARTLFTLPPDAIAFVRSSVTRAAATAWEHASIVIATPQRVAVGIARGTRTLDGFGLVIIDECHHAAERHASITVAAAAAAQGMRIVGLTASPGDDAVAIERVRKNLRLDRWVEIPDEATDAFRPPVRKHRVTVLLTAELSDVIRAIEDEILACTTVLAAHGHLDRATRAPAPSECTEAIERMRKREAYGRIPYAAAALALTTALTALVAGDLTHALVILRSAVDRRVRRQPHAPRTATARLLRSSPTVIAAGRALRALVDAGTPHPKWEPLLAAIRAERTERPDARILVYTRYATAASRLAPALADALGCATTTVLGRKHMKPAEAVARLDAFARGDIPIVVASPVVREGLHIPAIDLLVEYAPPLNGIERKQLHGRVGRTASGTIIALVSNHELDQRYSYSAEAGARRMRSVLRSASTGAGAMATPHVRHTHRSAFSTQPEKPAAALAAHIRSGAVFERFAVREARLCTGSHDQPYVEMTVGDRTGTLVVRHWCPDGAAQAEAIVRGFPIGSVIIVRGYCDRADHRTVIVNPREGHSIVPCPTDDYAPADYDDTPPF